MILIIKVNGRDKMKDLLFAPAQDPKTVGGVGEKPVPGIHPF